MKTRKTFIDAGETYHAHPVGQPQKKKVKIEILKKGLKIIQYIAPQFTSKVIWHYFTKPGYPKFTEAQKMLIQKAQVSTSTYRNHEIFSYKWGYKGPRVLLVHGWNSKVADFRKIIEVFVEKGFVVEGIDMKAHGQSSGKHSALPEFRDILKNYYVKHGPYDAIIGYSMGGIAAGIMLSEVSSHLQPQKLFLVAAPPHVRYFFKSAVQQAGCNDDIYSRLCSLVDKQYGESVDYYDIRNKAETLKRTEIHLIYDETDPLVPFEYGLELSEKLESVHFIHTRGIGHYRIISNPEIVNYLTENIEPNKILTHE